MNVDEKVGRNIRKYRMAYNMTLKELAVRLHKSVSTVSKYEKGDIIFLAGTEIRSMDISLDISTFLELSKIFKVSPLAIIGDEIAEEEEECTYAETIEKLYMYSYDGIGKVIVKSLIEQQAVEGKNNKYKVHLFNDVSEVKEPGECGGLYTGEYEKEGFIGTYMLHNQALKSEHIMISCVNNLVNPGQQLALVSGLSNYTMLPVTFKAVISEKEIVNKEKLMNLLAFNKEDLKLMKQMNYLTIQNIR